jgi:hypothetical protein
VTSAIPPGPRSLRVRLAPCPALPALGAAWQALEAHAATSFFTSWTWIGCWLRHLPSTLRPLLLQVHGSGDEPAQGDPAGACVGLGLLVPHRTQRLRCWPSRGLVLHASGLPAWDAITIEHNGLLARSDIATDVHRAAWQALLDGSARHGAARGRAWPPIDHIRIPGVPSRGASLANLGDEVGTDAVHHPADGTPWLVHRDPEPAWRADLVALTQGSSDADGGIEPRGGGPAIDGSSRWQPGPMSDSSDHAAPAGAQALPGTQDIVSCLGPGTRASIRRSLRRYAALGPVVLEAASSSDEALQFLQRLAHWHQRQWTARGEPGAFANPHFEAFHRDLITAAWPRAQVELLRLRAGPQEIGLLYNFVHRDTVSTYQSGLNLDLLEGHHHPGLVLHALAMQRARDAGFTVYDFLAGDARHKRQLGAQPYAMHTVHLSRPDPIARLEAAWRQLKARRARRP